MTVYVGSLCACAVLLLFERSWFCLIVAVSVGLVVFRLDIVVLFHGVNMINILAQNRPVEKQAFDVFVIAASNTDLLSEYFYPTYSAANLQLSGH